MSSGSGLLGGVAGAGGVGAGPLPWLVDRPKGSDPAPLPVPVVEEAPNALPPRSEANGSVLAGKAATGLAAGREAAGAAPNRSKPAGAGAVAAPKGSAPNESRAAAAGASLEVEKVDHTSAPGEPADSSHNSHTVPHDAGE